MENFCFLSSDLKQRHDCEKKKSWAKGNPFEFSWVSRNWKPCARFEGRVTLDFYLRLFDLFWSIFGRQRKIESFYFKFMETLTMFDQRQK